MPGKIFKVLVSVFILAVFLSCEGASDRTGDPTVVFNSHGGSVVKSQVVLKGELVNEPENPVRMNYRFDGWFREPACTTAWDFTIDAVDADVTLYAGWTASSPSGLSEFAIVNSQTGSPYRLDIVYNKEFSGDISYIVNYTELGITTSADFDNCGVTAKQHRSQQMILSMMITSHLIHFRLIRSTIYISGTAARLNIFRVRHMQVPHQVVLQYQAK